MKFIQLMKTALEGFNAVAVAAAAQMEENANRFRLEALEAANAPVRAGVQEAYTAARETINNAHAAALSLVDSWAEITPEKLDAQTVALLSGGLSMTAADFRRLILRFEDNYVMLSAIAAEAEKRDMLFQCGYIPAPEDKRLVYDKYYRSALSMLDTINEHYGISENLIAGFADPSHLTDPRYIAVLNGLAATQPGQIRAVEDPAPTANFGFEFRPAAANPTRW